MSGRMDGKRAKLGALVLNLVKLTGLLATVRSLFALTRGSLPKLGQVALDSLEDTLRIALVRIVFQKAHTLTAGKSVFLSISKQTAAATTPPARGTFSVAQTLAVGLVAFPFLRLRVGRFQTTGFSRILYQLGLTRVAHLCLPFATAWGQKVCQAPPRLVYAFLFGVANAQIAWSFMVRPESMPPAYYKMVLSQCGHAQPAKKLLTALEQRGSILDVQTVLQGLPYLKGKYKQESHKLALLASGLQTPVDGSVSSETIRQYALTSTKNNNNNSNNNHSSAGTTTITTTVAAAEGVVEGKGKLGWQRVLDARLATAANTGIEWDKRLFPLYTDMVSLNLWTHIRGELTRALKIYGTVYGTQFLLFQARFMTSNTAILHVRNVLLKTCRSAMFLSVFVGLVQWLPGIFKYKGLAQKWTNSWVNKPEFLAGGFLTGMVTAFIEPLGQVQGLLAFSVPRALSCLVTDLVTDLPEDTTVSNIKVKDLLVRYGKDCLFTLTWLLLLVVSRTQFYGTERKLIRDLTHAI